MRHAFFNIKRYNHTIMPSSSTLIRRDVQFISDNMNKNALIKALRKHGLTATKVIKPIVDALDATDNDGKPDHATRLRSATLAIQLLNLTKSVDPDDNKTAKTINKALHSGDEVELQRIIFNKQKPDNRPVNKPSGNSS